MNTAARQARAPSRMDRARRIGVLVLVALATAFAVLNVDEVEVNWILGTWSTPLIVVIAVAFGLGAGAGYLVATRRSAGRASATGRETRH